MPFESIRLCLFFDVQEFLLRYISYFSWNDNCDRDELVRYNIMPGFIHVAIQFLSTSFHEVSVLREPEVFPSVHINCPGFVKYKSVGLEY